MRNPRVFIVAALLTVGAVGFVVVAGCTATSGTASAPPVSPPAVGMTAPGAPGVLSHFDLARKDCVGTAASIRSKVWYTVADGVLSDVYSPTVDNTNVETMQYVVTDGRSFLICRPAI